MSAAPPPPTSGVYRFRNLEVTDPNPSYYLTMGSTNVEVATLNRSNQKQMWNVTKKADGSYSIVNVATGQSMFPVAPTSSERDYKVLADTSTSATATSWTIEPKESGNAFLIGATGSFAPQVVDLSVDQRVILWERNLHPNQWWAVEPAGPQALKEGRYHIRSKARSNPDKYLYFQNDKNAGMLALDPSSKTQTWDVKQNGDGSYSISYTATADPLGATKWDNGKATLRGDAGATNWTLTPQSDGSFTINAVGAFAPMVVDLSEDDWVVLWEPNQQPRQYWYFESV